jgi:iron complex outermembrane receptor protein
VSLSGANLLTRWRHVISDTSTFQVQSYYDQTQRFTIGSGALVLNTYDIELQDSLTLGSRNEIVWGGGYRTSRYGFTNTSTFLFLPENATLNLENVFAQDSIALASRLKLIIGLKLEDDPYSGTSPLPDARLSWKVSDTSMIWAAVSQAIRSATPFDRTVVEYLGTTLFLVGGPEFKPEKVTAYELGYRAQIGSSVSFSASGFYNVYSDLRSIEFAPTGLVLPLQWGNSMEGDTYGVELWGNYQVRDWWQLAFGFNELREKLHFVPGNSGLLGIAQAGDDPDHQFSLRSSMNLGAFTLDADLRSIGSLPNPEVPAYTELNARIGWPISKRWEAALSGSNLLHPYHEEFTAPPSERISRAVYADVRLRM